MNMFFIPIQVLPAVPAPPVAPAWLLVGNAGITPATNFIGTTDLQTFIFKTNNLERMRITSDGLLGIGTTTPVVPFLGSATVVDIGTIVGNAASLYLHPNGTTGSNQGFQLTATPTGNVNVQNRGTGYMQIQTNSAVNQPRLWLMPDGTAGVTALAPTAARFAVDVNTAAIASMRFYPSVGVNVSAPNIGDLWFNGTNLYFRRNISTTVDLLQPPLKTFTPAGSADPVGVTGDITNDDNFVYIKTAGGGWKRAALAAF